MQCCFSDVGSVRRFADSFDHRSTQLDQQQADQQGRGEEGGQQRQRQQQLKERGEREEGREGESRRKEEQGGQKVIEEMKGSKEN